MDKVTLDLLEKLALKEVVVDFEFHLHEADVQDAERIDEEVRIIEIPQTKVEFGFETDLDNPDMVNIEFGYAKLTLPKKALNQAIDDWKIRSIAYEVLKNEKK